MEGNLDVARGNRQGAVAMSSIALILLFTVLSGLGDAEVLSTPAGCGRTVASSGVKRSSASPVPVRHAHVLAGAVEAQQ
jgi:hypothetical protein